VTDSVTRRSIGGARVKLEARERALFTKCDENGRFQFQSVPVGEYLARADQLGYMQVGEPIAVRLSSDKTRVRVNVLLEPYGVVSGRITDSAGVPMECVGVELLKLRPIDSKQAGPPDFAARRGTLGDRETVAVATTNTNDLGEYRFGHLPAGTYAVRFASAQHPSYPDPTERATYYPHTLRAASARPVAVAAGQEVTGIDIQAIRQATVRISGHLVPTVYSPKGHSFAVHADVAIWLADAPERSADDLNWQGGFSNSDFDMGYFLPGEYVIEAVASDQPDFIHWRKLMAGRRTFEASDKDLDDVEIPMQALVDLQGAVVFEKNCPAVPISIVPEVQPGGLRRFAKFDPQVAGAASGAFTLPGLVPGKYTLTIRPQPPGATAGNRYSVASAKLGDRDVLQDGFEIDGQPAGALRVVMACDQPHGTREAVR
jgi:hypothetical protein